MIDKRDHVGSPISSRRLLFVLLYFLVVSAVLMYLHVGLVPDILVPVLLGAAFVVGQPWLFVRDWGVFLLVLILWQQTGPVAQWAGFPAHMTDLIDADKFLTGPLLHGQLPQVWLQQHLYHPGFSVRTYHAAYWSGHVYHAAGWDSVYHAPSWRWYDIVSAVIYGLHFPEPLVVGFVIWLRDRALFRRFAAAFLTLAAMSFIIYIVYPAVPPWMASKQYHAIPHINKIFDDFNYAVQQKMFGHQYFSLLNVGYDKVAAMPSLHAAFPVLGMLYLCKAFGRWGLLMLVYVVTIWFAVVYMGEHWTIDVLVGLVCAVVAYADVESVARWWSERERGRSAVGIPALAGAPSAPARPAGGRGWPVGARRASTVAARAGRRLFPGAAATPTVEQRATTYRVGRPGDAGNPQAGASGHIQQMAASPAGHDNGQRTGLNGKTAPAGEPTIRFSAEDREVLITLSDRLSPNGSEHKDRDAIPATVTVAAGQFHGRIPTTIAVEELAALRRLLVDLDARAAQAPQARWQAREAALSLAFNLDRLGRVQIEVDAADRFTGTRLIFPLNADRGCLTTWSGQIADVLEGLPALESLHVHA
jgi:hypothetical protein